MKTQQGNALFIILIAVALFAALSYAVTQSGRGGGTAQRESDTIAAAQLSQFLGLLNSAVMRMNVSGTAMTAIKIYNGTNGDCGSAYQLCATGTDYLFAPDGGGVSISKFPAGDFKATNKGFALPNQPATFNTTNMWADCNEGLGDWGYGTSAPDRGFFFLNLSKGVCTAYNKALKIPGIPNEDAAADAALTGSELTYCYKQTTAPNAGDYEIFNMLWTQ